MSNPNDYYRFSPLPVLSTGTDTNYRSEYDRDYARVLHSPSFRRLQNKTQLFPGQESDFFRNRLTHSLEVSQIARSIAKKLNAEHPEVKIEPEVCAIAGLLHDIGHPPFGHNGERALDNCMKQAGGFEGNAQTLRIVTRLEKKERVKDILVGEMSDQRVGLNLTARVIASILKYDKRILSLRDEKSPLVKGYYESEKEVVDVLKEKLIGKKIQEGSFKTVECGVMDVADDIAYSTYDVEDAFKAGFLTPYAMLSAEEKIFEQIIDKMRTSGIETDKSECQKALVDIFDMIFDETVEHQKSIDKQTCNYEHETIGNILQTYKKSEVLATDGYYRTEFSSKLVNSFINGVCIDVNKENSILSKVYFDKETELRVNLLKHFSYVALINSSRLKVAENRGGEIVKNLFERLSDEGGEKLLPEDFAMLYNLSGAEAWRKRVICDFIAGMTDRYAMEFYGRLFSENPQTIFKPI